MSLEYYVSALAVPLLFHLLCRALAVARHRWVLGALWACTVSLLVLAAVLLSSIWILVAVVAGIAVTVAALMWAVRADLGTGTWIPSLALWVFLAPIVIFGIGCTFDSRCY